MQTDGDSSLTLAAPTCRTPLRSCVFTPAIAHRTLRRISAYFVLQHSDSSTAEHRQGAADGCGRRSSEGGGLRVAGAAAACGGRPGRSRTRRAAQALPAGKCSSSSLRLTVWTSTCMPLDMSQTQGNAAIGQRGHVPYPSSQEVSFRRVRQEARNRKSSSDR